MSQIGEISVRVTADSTSLQKGMKQANQSVEESTAKIEENMLVWAKWGAAAAVAAAGAAAAIIKSQLDSIDALAKTSDKLGIAVEDLQALRFAAEQSGVSAGSLDTALQFMTRGLSEAAKGAGEAKKVITELGLDAQKLGKMTPDQQMRILADAMQGVENQSDRVRMAFSLFGRSGTDLVNMLKNGSAGLDDFSQQAKELGLTLDRDAAAGVEAANDAINRMRTAMTGAAQQITAELAPVITEIADSFVAMAQEAGGVGAAIESAMNKIATVMNVVAGIIVARMTASGAAFVFAQYEAMRYQAALASMAGVSATAATATGALAVATRGLSTAFALIGGPAGLVGLTAFGIYQLSSGYRENTQAAEERLEKMREELRLMPQLNSAQAEYNRTVQNAYKPLEAYTNEVDRLFAEQVRGLSRSDFQSQFDKSSAALKRAEERLQKYTDAGVTNQQRMMQAREQVRKYAAEVGILSGIVPDLTTSEEKAGVAIGKVSSALADQLFELQNGKAAYEDLLILRAANVDASSEEGKALLALAAQHRELQASQSEEQKQKDTGKQFVERLRERLSTEEQLQNQKYKTDQDALKKSLDSQVITHDEYNRLLEELQVEHNERLAKIQAETAPKGMRYSPVENQAFIDGLVERFASQTELEEMQYAGELERLQEARAQQLLTEEQFLAQKDALSAHYADMQTAREQQVQQQITSMRMQAAQSAIGLLDMFAGKSEAAAIAAIALNKGLAIAQVIQNTAAAQMRALAELGPIAGAAAAAKIGLYGKIQAGIIAATGLVQVGGAMSGSNSTLASVNGLPATRTTGGQSVGQPSAGASRTISINLTGGTLFTAEQIRELIGQINEQIGDGVLIATGG